MQIVSCIFLMVGIAVLLISACADISIYRKPYLKASKELQELKDKLYSPQLEIQQNFESIAEKALHGGVIDTADDTSFTASLSIDPSISTVGSMQITSEGYGEECKNKPERISQDAYSRVRNALFKAYAHRKDK